MTIKELLESMVCSIVDDVENVKIEEIESESGLSFHVAVARDDVGKLIGTKGRIAVAIRTVAKAAGAKQGVRVLVNVDKSPLEI
jgi:predicted RNA-binding protein YlqC (UPF0109 family)